MGVNQVPTHGRRGRRRWCFVAVAVPVPVGSVASCGAKKSHATATASTSSAAATTTVPAPTTTAPPPVFPLTGLLTGGGPAARPAPSLKIDNINAPPPQSRLDNTDPVY